MTKFVKTKAAKADDRDFLPCVICGALTHFSNTICSDCEREIPSPCEVCRVRGPVIDADGELVAYCDCGLLHTVDTSQRSTKKEVKE